MYIKLVSNSFVYGQTYILKFQSGDDHSEKSKPGEKSYKKYRQNHL